MIAPGRDVDPVYKDLDFRETLSEIQSPLRHYPSRHPIPGVASNAGSIQKRITARVHVASNPGTPIEVKVKICPVYEAVNYHKQDHTQGP